MHTAFITITIFAVTALAVPTPAPAPAADPKIPIPKPVQEWVEHKASDATKWTIGKGVDAAKWVGKQAATAAVEDAAKGAYHALTPWNDRRDLDDFADLSAQEKSDGESLWEYGSLLGEEQGSPEEGMVKRRGLSESAMDPVDLKARGVMHGIDWACTRKCTGWNWCKTRHADGDEW